MIKRLNIQLKTMPVSPFHSDICVKIHGFIMSIISSEYAKILHEQDINPFSIYIQKNQDGFMLRLSALTRQSFEITDAMKKTDSIMINPIGKFPVINIEEENFHFDDCMDFVEKYRLNIVSPCMCKHNGKLYWGTSLKQYFKSVMLKVNKFENLSLTTADLDNAFSAMNLEDYIFRSENYRLEGKSIKAMTGSLDFSLQGRDENASLLRRLLRYSTYCGIGGKTSLGMGGTELILKF